MIARAKEESQKDRIFAQWVVQLPLMDKDHFVSLSDYTDKMLGKNIDRRSDAEIIAEVLEIEKQLSNKGEP